MAIIFYISYAKSPNLFIIEETKMKQRKLSIIGLLLVSPLLMGFSLEPYKPYTREYNDIDVTMTKVETDVYEFNVKNTGDGYVYKNSSLHTGDLTITNNTPQDQFFTNHLLIRPGAEATIISNGDYSEYDFSNSEFHALALVAKDTTLTFIGSKAIAKSENSRWYYYIDCEIKGNVPNYGYYYVVTLDYDGVEYTVETLTDAYNKLYYYFSDPDIFDASKATVKEIVGFKHELPPREDGMDYGAFAIGGMLYILVVSLSVQVGIFLFIVLPLIIIFRTIRKKKIENSSK